MKLQFIGTGAFFTEKSYHTNFIIEENGKRFLIDAGSDLKWAMREAGLKIKDLDAIYISHLHGDHAGGIEWVGFGSYFIYKNKIKLFGNGELLENGWDHTWSGGMRSVAGKVMTLDDYFDVNKIQPNKKFTWEGIEFSIVQVVHIVNCYSIVPSYGLIVKLQSGKKIFFTCDSQHCPAQLTDFYRECDVVFHDCETTQFKSGVHANYQDLVTLPKELKEKMYLLHYQDNILEQYDPGKIGEGYVISGESLNNVRKDGFRGFIDKGQVIEEKDLFVGLE